MRTVQIICMALMLSGTVGCAQVPTMQGVGAGVQVANHNNNNEGDWDNSGNSDQANQVAITVGNNSNVRLGQRNVAVGGASQQIGDGNNISVRGRAGFGNSSNDGNVGEWEDSGNAVQTNLAAITGGTGTRVRTFQDNVAVGATAQQIGNGNNLSVESGRRKH